MQWYKRKRIKLKQADTKKLPLFTHLQEYQNTLHVNCSICKHVEVLEKYSSSYKDGLKTWANAFRNWREFTRGLGTHTCSWEQNPPPH